jgi:ATP-dependent Clp protease adaptor protein ClpS
MTKDIPKQVTEKEHQTHLEKEYMLMLYNDDVHSFDYVIGALIEVCDHTEEQATQCTLIVHYKGSCDIKKGSLKELKPMRKALINKELKATIN